MKVTVIPIVLGAAGTLIKRYVMGLQDLQIRLLVEATLIQYY